MITIEVNDAIKAIINIRLLNINNAPKILTALKDASLEHDKDFIIDLKNVDSLDSYSISMLVEFSQLLKENNKNLTFINLSAFVRRIFDMLHMSQFFNLQ